MKKLLLITFLSLVTYCSQAQTIYVNASASGLNDGSDWTNAFTDLQSAIGGASSGEIWVAAGTYYPGGSGINSATFTLKDNVSILGGFNGTETINTQRLPDVHVTILSGDLDMSNSPTANDAYHVVSGGNAGLTAMLDGFTITRGNAVGAGFNDRGAGLFFHPTISGTYSPVINDCDITMNVSSGDGCGMYIVCDQPGGNTSGANIYNSKFFFNQAGGYGGAIAAYASGTLAFCTPTVENCLFHSNSASGNDGNHIIVANGSNGEVHFVLTSCTIIGNSTGGEVTYQDNGFNGSFDMSNTTAFGLDFFTDATFNANYCNGNPTYWTGGGNINLDPIFMNEGTNDYHLRCSSPMINSGGNGYPNLSVDHDGNPRSSGFAPDIGAYETNYTNPTVNANASSPSVCVGSNVTLYGSGTAGVTYSWSNGVVDNSPFTPGVSNTYTLTGTDAFYCVATETVIVTVNPLPAVIANTTDSDSTMCEGSMVTLYGSGSPATYVWDNGVTDNTPFAAVAGTNIFNVTGTDGNGCSWMSSITLTIDDALHLSAGTNLNGCANEATGITVSASGTNVSMSMWNSTNGGSFTSPTTLMSFYNASAAEVTAGQAVLYIDATSMSPNCPLESDTMVIVFHTPPTFNLGPDYTICETDSILLQTSISNGTPPFIYNWSNGTTLSTANNEMYMPTATENVSLLVNDMYGCFGKDTVHVTVDASEMLSGTMHVGAGVLTDGVMYMLKFHPQQLAFDTMFAYPFSAGTGTYSFPGMPHGDYLIKIVPDTIIFPNLIPTYYGDAFQWDSATVITHNCISPFVADINMIALLGGTGTGAVSGFIKEGFGFGTRMMPGHDQIFAPGGPLKGVDVKLGKNPGGGIQARTMSDDNGHYQFNNLPNDSYRIYVDIPGLPMDSFYIVNVTNDSTTNLVYYADSNSVYPFLTPVGIHQYTEAANSFDVYPNPAHNNTSVKFELMSEHTASIRLMDITGKQVMNIQLNKLPKGKHEYQLNFSNQQLSSGVYFIQVMSDKGMQVKKLVVE